MTVINWAIFSDVIFKYQSAGYPTLLITANTGFAI